MEDFVINDQMLDAEEAIQQLYQNRMFTDVSVILTPGNEVFYAHKLILSLFSPVLCDRFYGINSDSSGKLYVEGVDISAVSNMLSYFYGEPLVLENTFQIKETKKLADKYKIDELGNKCKMKIYELDVDVSNVLIVLEMAVQYQNENKEKECLEIIGRNKESVFASETFIEMKFEDVCRIFEALRQMGFLDEVQYLRSALIWMGPDVDTHKNKLMEKIKISSLSLDEFIDIVIDFPNFLTNTEISHAMKEIKSLQKTEDESRDRLEESENVTESEKSTEVGSLDDSENIAESGYNSAVPDIPTNEQKNEISETKRKVIITISNVENVNQAVVTIKDEIASRGLQFEIPDDMEGVFVTLGCGEHAYENVDISYEGLYYMMACLRDVRAEMSSVNSIEAFKAAAYFQFHRLRDFLLMKIGNIVDYDPLFLDSLRCLPFFEDRLLQLLYSKPRCVILHPNFVFCSVELIETVLEQNEMRLRSELQLLLVTIQWLEARNRQRWDSRSRLLNQIAFENISSSDLVYILKRFPYFFTGDEMNSILLYKNGINSTESSASLPEWYSFKPRSFVSEECE